jgi:hypothetical protein
VYAYDEYSNYTSLSAQTDDQGVAIFQRADFGEGSYTFRVDYLSGQFWSKPCVAAQAEQIPVVIEEETVEIAVTMTGKPEAGVTVYLFSADGTYLGVYALTDSDGKMSF